MIEVRAKSPVIYNQTVYKTGERFQMEETDAAKMNAWVTVPTFEVAEVDDGLVVTDGLPPLYDEPKKSKGKRNV